MARSSLIATFTLCLILHSGHLGEAHYTDDSDYDFDYYKDLPEKRVVEKFEDDFYIINEPQEAEGRSPRITSGIEDAETPAAGTSPHDKLNVQQDKWPPGERVYRYTKHRIPGYDYDELDFVETRKYRRCDERSVWTHCLCQFTCTDPNIVDCYAPCNSGCECREHYVYDERTGQCVLPEQCQPDEDYLLY